jgi:hypothetical protein
MTSTIQIASGFEFTPMPDGTVLMEFCDDNGRTINRQVITTQSLVRLPLVAYITLTAMRQGADAAEKLVRVLRAVEELEDNA